MLSVLLEVFIYYRKSSDFKQQSVFTDTTFVSIFIAHLACALCCAYSLSHVRLCDPMDCNPPGSSVHGDSSGKNTGVGCHDLLQGIFLTQGLNPGL